MQALYQMHMSGTSAVDVFAQFQQSHDMKRVDTEYLRGLLIGIDTHRVELLALIEPKLEQSKRAGSD